jgi:hypothetical protein
MKKLNTIRLLVAALFVSGSAQAGYGWSKTCNGTPAGWAAKFKMARDRCSMPDNGWAHVAYNNAGWNWSAATWTMDYNWSYDTGCTIQMGNNLSQTAVVPAAQLSGHGRTACLHNSCILSQDKVECDVKMANHLSFTPQDESFWGWTDNGSGQVALVHEFGHVLGLGDRALDSSNFNVMRGNTPLPLTGGNGAQPFPDDAAGVRWLYGGHPYNALTVTKNVFTSAQKISGGAIVAADPVGTVNVCRGSTIQVTYTIGNNGWFDVTSGFRVYINNTAVPGSGTNIFTATSFQPKHSFATETKTLTIPAATPLGIHWIWFHIDTGSAIAESVETDNTVHSGKTINVVAC